MNEIRLSGRLTKDVELRGGEKKIGVFTLAVERKYKNQQGERDTDFPQIKTFNRLAENCAKFLKKGSQVIVLAEIRTGSYEKDGKRHYTTEIIANDVEFLDSRRTTDTNSNQANRGYQEDEPPYINQEDPFPGSQEYDVSGGWPFGN